MRRGGSDIESRIYAYYVHISKWTRAYTVYTVSM